MCNHRRVVTQNVSIFQRMSLLVDRLIEGHPSRRVVGAWCIVTYVLWSHFWYHIHMWCRHRKIPIYAVFLYSKSVLFSNDSSISKLTTLILLRSRVSQRESGMLCVCGFEVGSSIPIYACLQGLQFNIQQLNNQFSESLLWGGSDVRHVAYLVKGLGRYTISNVCEMY